jgi:cytochrome P450
MPERFDAIFPRSAYLPFGIGPHRCIGDAIAGPAIVLVLAMLAQRFTLTMTGPDRGSPEAGIILRPPKGIRVRVAAR